MKKNPKIFILLIMSICLLVAFAACGKGNGTDTDGKNDTTFVSSTLDGVKSIGNGNSAAPTDLVPDNSGKVTFNTPESKKPHAITVTSELNHGILRPDVNEAVGGKTVTLSYASPTVGGGGCKIRQGSLCVNGVAITDFQYVDSDGSQDYYTTFFIMPEVAATITASEYLYYNVGIAEFIDNGGISLSMTEYEYGKTTAITVTITPDSGYRLKEGSLRWGDTVITKTNGEYTFTIPSDRYGQIIVHAEFEEIVPDYAVVVSSSIQNGTVQANVSRAEEGDIVTLTFIPNENYALKSGTLKYTPSGGTATAVTESAGAYSFVMPASDVTIDAEFARRYNIYFIVAIKVDESADFWLFGATSGEGIVYEGVTVCTVTGPTAACEGDEATFIISIDPGYAADPIDGVILREYDNQLDPEHISSRTFDENGNISSVTISAMPVLEFDEAELYIYVYIRKN